MRIPPPTPSNLCRFIGLQPYLSRVHTIRFLFADAGATPVSIDGGVGTSIANVAPPHMLVTAQPCPILKHSRWREPKHRFHAEKATADAAITVMSVMTRTTEAFRRYRPSPPQRVSKRGAISTVSEAAARDRQNQRPARNVVFQKRGVWRCPARAQSPQG